MKKNVPRSEQCQRRTRQSIAAINAGAIEKTRTTWPIANIGKSIASARHCPVSMLSSWWCSKDYSGPRYTRRLLIAFIGIIFVNCFHVGNCVIQVESVSFNASDSLQSLLQADQAAAAADEAVASATHQQQQQQYSDNALRKLLDESRISKNRDVRQLAAPTPTIAPIKINGFRIEESDAAVETDDGGIPSVLVNKVFTVRVFGTGLTKNMVIAFTAEANEAGTPCEFPVTLPFEIVPGSLNETTAQFKAKLPKTEYKPFYICTKQNTPNEQLRHQGKDLWLQLHTYETMLPLWASLVIILLCISFSSLFSGLNLGLMSLDRTELKILRNTGSAKEREYARLIQPVRDQGNYLLCSILLGNVLVNSIFTILLDSLTSGLFAVIVSTLAIVLMGEIVPQAICSRHGLAIGAKTIMITKTVMFLTWPLAFPISKTLDFFLGEEIGNVYNRERLKELVKVTNDVNDLDKNEVNIISGALELRKKTVADIMTHIEDAFMLSLEAVLDFETVSEIMKSGYSRIPVFDGDKKNIVTLLYIKDLAFVDTDDNTPLRTLCEFYQNPVHFVFEDITLDVMFNQFKEGSIGHIAFVHRVNNEGEGDPFYETVGLVTLEDVIEELIQAEIVDETDVFVDNRTKIKRHRKAKPDFSAFAERKENQNIHISPQLQLATFQYLSTAVDAFKKEVISEPILRRLLNQDIIHIIKCKGKDKTDPSLFIFQQGKAVDFFVLILEGRVEVTVGKENLLFEAGPFTYFGTQALVQNVVVDSPSQQIMGSLQSLNMDAKIRNTFTPDYSVRCASDVIYIAIKRSLYLTAKKATLLEKTRKSGTEPTGEVDDEVEKLLHSLNEDEKHVRIHQTLRKPSSATANNTAAHSLNDVSQQSRSLAASTQHNSQGSNSADIIDDVSLNSQVTSDPATGRNSIEPNDDKDSIVSSPLLPKPVIELSKKQHKQ